MTLGERIYQLRRGRGMSQEELADVCAVSRQSVSKWENDSAVPELEKLICISKLFGVSLDELVNGEEPQPAAGEDTISESPPELSRVSRAGNGSSSGSSRKIAGTILLCMGFLTFLLLTLFGGLLGGLIFAFPFLLCGAVCFIFRRRVGLWCTWVVYFCVDLYLNYATGTRRAMALHPRYYSNDAVNPITLVMAWIMLLCALALIAATVYSFRNTAFSRRRYIGSWSIWLGGHGLSLLLGVLLSRSIVSYAKTASLTAEEYHAQQMMLAGYSTLSFLLSWLTMAAFTAILIGTIALIRHLRQSKPLL